MNKFLVLYSVVILSGCQSVVKDIFEIAATPDELAKMPASNVCKHLGYSQWRGQPQAYINAKNEAKKRIEANEVTADDCIVFSKMAMQSKEHSAAQLNQMMNDMKTTTTNCVNTGVGVSCTSNSY